MLAEATVVLLTLMVLSHLALQAHCFTARKSLPSVLATLQDRFSSLVKTADDRTSAVARSVDDGVDLLEELINRDITPDALTDQTSAHDPLGAVGT